MTGVSRCGAPGSQGDWRECGAMAVYVRVCRGLLRGGEGVGPRFEGGRGRRELTRVPRLADRRSVPDRARLGEFDERPGAESDASGWRGQKAVGDRRKAGAVSQWHKRRARGAGGGAG